MLTSEPQFTYTSHMSRNDVIKNIDLELERLNHQIDLKIIRGLDYRREARRHRWLTSQLADLSPSTGRWMSSLVSALAR